MQKPVTTPSSQLFFSSTMRHFLLTACAMLLPACLGAQTTLHVTPISNSSAVRIEPGQIRRWDLEVSPASPDCRLTGRILGLAGGQKDVDVMLMSEDDYINWSNHETP